MNALTSADLPHVAYKGGGPALADLLGRQISRVFATPPESVPYIKANRLRPFGVTSPTRFPAMPDLPSIERFKTDGVALVGSAPGEFQNTSTPRSEKGSRLSKRQASRATDVDNALPGKEKMMRVGFIGLGTMGAPIALNAIRGGFELTVHDVRKAAAEPHLKGGASWADSVEDAALRAGRAGQT